METIAKAFKFFSDMLDQILAVCKFGEEVGKFTKEYLHEHPDEIDGVYTVFKFSNPSLTVIIKKKEISLIRNLEKFFNDQEQILEAIVKKKRLQSGEDEILYRNSLGPELPPDKLILNKNILVYIMCKWNSITKQIKMFLQEHPDAPFNIEISSFDNKRYKVIMNKISTSRKRS